VDLKGYFEGETQQKVQSNAELPKRKHLLKSGRTCVEFLQLRHSEADKFAMARLFYLRGKAASALP